MPKVRKSINMKRNSINMNLKINILLKYYALETKQKRENFMEIEDDKESVFNNILIVAEIREEYNICGI